MLIKLYGAPPAAAEAARRYSPSECLGARKSPVTGNPDPAHISTSYVERQNLTMRMQMRRFTRLTNTFSKGREPRSRGGAALHALQFRAEIHRSLRVTPAMAAGITARLWAIKVSPNLYPNQFFWLPGSVAAASAGEA